IEQAGALQQSRPADPVDDVHLVAPCLVLGADALHDLRVVRPPVIDLDVGILLGEAVDQRADGLVDDERGVPEQRSLAPGAFLEHRLAVWAAQAGYLRYRALRRLPGRGGLSAGCRGPRLGRAARARPAGHEQQARQERAHAYDAAPLCQEATV